MQATSLALAAMCLPLVIGPASASPQPYYEGCGWSDGGALIHVWREDCQGVAFWSISCHSPQSFDERVDAIDGYVVHVVVLGSGCLTGVILQPVP